MNRLLRSKLKNHEVKIAELTEDNQRMCRSVISNNWANKVIVADPEKFVPKPKKPPRPFTDPQAEADSEAFIQGTPERGDLKHFFELYNGMEDLAEDLDADGVRDMEETWREQGRDLLPAMIRDGIDEERARRILRKAFALRFRAAHPEFEI